MGFCFKEWKMNNKNYKIAPKLFYSLPQAIREIKNRTGLEVGIDDFFEYARSGVIDLSLKFNVFFTDDLNNKSFDENKNLEVENYSELEEFIKKRGGVTKVTQTTITPTGKKIKKEMIVENSSFASKYGNIFNAFFIRYIGILVLKNGLDFHYLDNECFLSDEFIARLYYQDNDFIDLKIKANKWRSIKNENEIFITAKELNKLVYQDNQENDEIIDNKQKAEQKINEQITIDPNKNAERIILNSIIATLENNPNIGRYSAVKSVLNYIEQERRDLKGFIRSDRHYVDKLKERGIERAQKRGKRTEKIKVVIKI